MRRLTLQLELIRLFKGHVIIACRVPRTLLPRSPTCESEILEVIYPQVPLRIPCYDLAPLTPSRFEPGMNQDLTEKTFG